MIGAPWEQLRGRIVAARIALENLTMQAAHGAIDASNDTSTHCGFGLNGGECRSCALIARSLERPRLSDRMQMLAVGTRAIGSVGI